MINFPDFHLNGRRPNTINDINNPLSQERGGGQFDQAGPVLSDISILCRSKPELRATGSLDLLEPFWRPVDRSHRFNCDPPG